MKIKALKEFQGSLNGYEVSAFEKGTVLDVDEQTARIFLDAGFCELVKEETDTNSTDKKKKQNADRISSENASGDGTPDAE